MAGWWFQWHRTFVLLAFACVLVLGARWIGAAYRRFRRRRIAHRALDAERTALELLRRQGYVVLATQAKQAWRVRHGERHLDINLRADAIVQRGERRFIAEVKSSSFVADLKHGPTRRQLLEYAVAYAADGVLLIDMHTQRVEEVTFPGLQRHGQKPWLLLVVCVLAFSLGAWFGLS